MHDGGPLGSPSHDARHGSPIEGPRAGVAASQGEAHDRGRVLPRAHPRPDGVVHREGPERVVVLRREAADLRLAHGRVVRLTLLTRELRVEQRRRERDFPDHLATRYGDGTIGNIIAAQVDQFGSFLFRDGGHAGNLHTLQ